MQHWGATTSAEHLIKETSHILFTLTFLPSAVIWATSPRRGHVHSSMVWERRKGRAFLSEWMEMCKWETQKNSYWKWMMSRGWSAVSTFPQKGGPNFQTVKRALGLRWGQEPHLLFLPSLFSHHQISTYWDWEIFQHVTKTGGLLILHIWNRIILFNHTPVTNQMCGERESHRFS